jgi:hypothetical protein
MNGYIIKHHYPLKSACPPAIYGSTALVDLGGFFSFLICTQSVRHLGRGISPSQAGKGLAGAVVICKVWRLAVAL